MQRRFLLVGLMVVVKPGSILQIAMACIYSILYLVFQMEAKPYLNISDDYLANVCSFSIVLVYVSCLFIKIDALTELQGVQTVLSLDLKDMFDVPASALIISLYISVLGSIGVSAYLGVRQVRAKRKQREREAKASKARKLRYVHNGEEVVPPKVAANGYHLFLSHVWATGQDQVRVMKQRLKEMCPAFSVFLDVDDLEDISDLEGYIDHTSTVLIFCSQGYFASKNCMREIRSAVRKGKPLLAVLEPEVGKGGLSVSEITHQLLAADDNYARWGFADDDGPHGEELVAALFAEEPIEWNRIGHFQDVTLRLIAERLLPDLDKAISLARQFTRAKSMKGSIRRALTRGRSGGPRTTSTVADRSEAGGPELGATFIQNEMAQQPTPEVPPPREGRRFHLYCSRHNLGAAEYAREVAEKLGLNLLITDEPKQLPLAEAVVVYLTSQTWTRGDSTEAFAADVLRAMKRGVRLHLAHEMPGVGGQVERHGVEFSTFFSCEAGATPISLLKIGIYDQIAVALKGGEWRRASMVLAMQEFAKSPAALEPAKGTAEEAVQVKKAKRASLVLAAHAVASTPAQRRASLGMGSQSRPVPRAPPRAGSSEAQRALWQKAVSREMRRHGATPLTRGSESAHDSRLTAQAHGAQLPAPVDLASVVMHAQAAARSHDPVKHASVRPEDEELRA